MKNLNKILISILIISAGLSIAQADPLLPTFTAYGQVFDTDGTTPVDGVLVNVTDLATGDSNNNFTTLGGWYLIDLYNSTNGDPIRIFASINGKTNITEIIQSGDMQVNLILQGGAPTPTLTLTLNTTMDGSSKLVDNFTSAVLLNTAGVTVATATSFPDNMTAQFNLSGITPGDYFIKVNNHAGALVPTRIDSNASDISQSVGRRLRNSVIGNNSNPTLYRIKSYPSEISSSHPVVNYTSGANESKYAYVIVPSSTNKIEVRVLNTSEELSNFTARPSGTHPEGDTFSSEPFQIWILGDVTDSTGAFIGNHGHLGNASVNTDCIGCHTNLGTKPATFPPLTGSGKDGWCFRCHNGPGGPSQGFVDPFAQTQAPQAGAPAITSRGNSKTNDANLSITVNVSETVRFNASANQSITTWNWFLNDVNQSNNFDNFSAPFASAGTYTVKANATNTNGTSNTVMWTVNAVSVKTLTMPITIKNANNIAGGNVKVLFNPAVVNISSVTAGDFGSPTANIDNPNGSVFISLAGTTAIGMNEAIFANIKFQGVGVGSSALNLTNAEFNMEDGSLVTPSLTNGSINVDSAQNISGFTPMVLNVIVNGNIAGTVTDASSILPISGATVTANGQSTVTGGDGNYSISIAPGTYTVTANASGYNSTSASNVVVVSGETVTQDFALQPTSVVISGISFSLSVSPSVNQVTIPGVVATYNLTLTNTGNKTDNYTLNYINPNNADTVNLNPSSVQNLGAGNSTNILLNVTNTSAGKFMVNVTATSQNDPGKNKSVSTTTTVLSANIVGFTMDTTGQKGRWINASVNVTNYNQTTGKWFVIDVSGVSSTGEPLVGTGTVFVNANTTVNNVPVLITVPGRVPTGDYQLIAGLWKLEEFPIPELVITTQGPQTVTIS